MHAHADYEPDDILASSIGLTEPGKQGDRSNRWFWTRILKLSLSRQLIRGSHRRGSRSSPVDEGRSYQHHLD
jgi:hypothetical protein